MAEVMKADIEAARSRLDEIEGYLHIGSRRKEIAELEEKSAQPGFWDDAEAASATMARLTRAKEDVAALEGARSRLGDAEAALELGLEMEDEALLGEAADALAALERDMGELELASWFTDELDHGDAIVTITPGQGGLEAQDWCEMLFHMYQRYCERRGWKVDVNDAPAAEVIGIDRATFTVSGKNAYGMLRAEAGVHRLVRISPTDAKKRRQTTFAGVEVLPVLPDDIEVEIEQSDLRIDVYHASGPGGQGVNTTTSAVRITHLPTGITAQCQNERSQHHNKDSAMRILMGRLYNLELEKRDAERQATYDSKDAIAFGSQIRTYTLQPFRLVKDHRTGCEGTDTDAILDGDIDAFQHAFLLWRFAKLHAQGAR